MNALASPRRALVIADCTIYDLRFIILTALRGFAVRDDVKVFRNLLLGSIAVAAGGSLLKFFPRPHWIADYLSLCVTSVASGMAIGLVCGWRYGPKLPATPPADRDE